jgi:hypothetical protein
VAALSIIAVAPPARAQQVIYEPAYCAFYYPYANCQNMGPGNPSTDPNYRRGPNWSGGETVGVAVKRPPHHRSTAMRKQ